MSKKNLALIGAGRWGKNLLRNFYEIGVLHTVCESNDHLTTKYKEEYSGVNFTTSCEELFRESAIDKIVIATPAATHFSLAKRALCSGKDLFVEKPLCLELDEAKELVELAEKKGKILMVGHLLHYHPIFQKMEEMIKGGAIGELKQLSCHRLKLGTFRSEENVLFSFAPHDFSILLQLLDQWQPTSLSCTGDSFITEGIHDTSFTKISFSEGKSAYVQTSWISPYKEQRIVAIGTQGLLTFDDTKEWEKKLHLISKPIERNEEGKAVANSRNESYIAVEKKEPLREECLHFIDCCKERKRAKTCGEEGLRTLELLLAADKSLKSGGEKISLSSERTYFAHPTAEIDKGAKIGEKCQIWHFSHIFNGAELGAECKIGQNVVIFPNVILGKRCKVQNNISLYSGVTVDDEVFLGPSVVFTNVINPRAHIDRRDHFAATHVGRGATIGANATIVCGNEIGDHAFIGAGAVVTKSVKPFALVVGNPARQVGWVSRSGCKLNLPLSSESALFASCPESGELYSLKGEKVEQVESAEMERFATHQ